MHQNLPKFNLQFVAVISTVVAYCTKWSKITQNVFSELLFPKISLGESPQTPLDFSFLHNKQFHSCWMYDRLMSQIQLRVPCSSNGPSTGLLPSYIIMVTKRKISWGRTPRPPSLFYYPICTIYTVKQCTFGISIKAPQRPKFPHLRNLSIQYSRACLPPNMKIPYKTLPERQWALHSVDCVPPPNLP